MNKKLTLLAGIVIWAIMFGLRFVFMALGLIAVPFSLVADGQDNTPPIWRLWANVRKIPPSWDKYDLKWWMYIYPVLVLGMAIVSYARIDYGWHPLVAIAFIFASIGMGLIAWDRDRFAKFWWMAIRNPVEGLDHRIKQPIREARPNPDELVRNGEMHNGALVKHESATRFMQEGVFWEYWYLKRRGKDKYFEFRIGWKFVDGNQDFVPTIQLGIRSS